MIAAGKTGGHIFPGIALAREIQARRPSAPIVFIGTTEGLETRLVPEAGFTLESVAASGFVGKSLLEKLRALLQLPRGFFEARRILRRYRARAVAGMGGYVSVPVLFAARSLGIPTLIHDSDALPGMSTRGLNRIATRTAVGVAAANARLARPGVVTGTPVRPEFFVAPDLDTHPAGGPPRVLVFGGSQGSAVLNRAMADAARELAGDGILAIHQTGDRHLDATRALYGHCREGWALEPFLPRLWEPLGWCDLVVARAGAMTLAELAAAGPPRGPRSLRGRRARTPARQRARVLRRGRRRDDRGARVERPGARGGDPPPSRRPEAPRRDGPQRAGAGGDRSRHAPRGPPLRGRSRDRESRVRFLRLRRLHFVGAGGVGMSGLAEILLLSTPLEISGCDLARSENTERLTKLGARIAYGHDAKHVRDADLVVISSAVQESNPEVAAARGAGIPVIRRAEMLAEIMRLKQGVAIAGHARQDDDDVPDGDDPDGGGLRPHDRRGRPQVRILGTNARLGKGDFLVAEADEFDRSFLELTPVVAVITNVEADHLDCYRDLADILDAFVTFRQPRALLRRGGGVRGRRRRPRGDPEGEAEGRHVRGVSGRGPPGARDPAGGLRHDLRGLGRRNVVARERAPAAPGAPQRGQRPRRDRRRTGALHSVSHDRPRDLRVHGRRAAVRDEGGERRRARRGRLRAPSDGDRRHAGLRAAGLPGPPPRRASSSRTSSPGRGISPSSSGRRSRRATSPSSRTSTRPGRSPSRESRGS